MNRDAKQKLVDELYNSIDKGLYKKDAPAIADAIEALIDEKIADLIPVYAMTEMPLPPLTNADYQRILAEITKIK